MTKVSIPNQAPMPELQPQPTQLFLQYVQHNLRKPHTMAELANFSNLSVANLKQQGAISLQTLETKIWQQAFAETTALALTEAEQMNYTARELALAFLFHLTGSILPNLQPYSTIAFNSAVLPAVFAPTWLKGARAEFNTLVGIALAAALENGEVQARTKLLQNQYTKFLWGLVPVVLQFWATDKSTDHSATDALIEKSVNWAFDLLGRNTFDTTFDLLHFLWTSLTNKRKF